MEENKQMECKNKCCGHCEIENTACCHNWKKCRIAKKVILFLVLIITFCLGTQWGEMKAQFRNERFGGRGGYMMRSWDDGYKTFNLKNSEATGEVKVNILDDKSVKQ